MIPLDVHWNLRTLRLARASGQSFRRARQHGDWPGADFFRFGRRLGWRMWLQGNTKSRAVLMSPVSLTRYFEFDFARRHLSDLRPEHRLLDISSPFLFSFHLATHTPRLRIRMINPDSRDLARTERMYKPGRITNIVTECLGISELKQEPAGSLDAIWSLSVLEHIHPDHGGDREACRALWRLLAPGGRLVLTLPTDLTCWEEYREKDPYGLTQVSRDPKGVFFQRFYDEAAIRDRIIGSIGKEPETLEWFGVKQAGDFHNYIQRWLEQGANKVVVHDPEEIAMKHQAYDSFQDMPGEGVCGLVFRKDAST